MANKDFVWFLSHNPNFLEVWAIEQSLRFLRFEHGKENERYYILTNDESEWRSKMKQLKNIYEFHKCNKFLITFTSSEKMYKAMEFLDYKLIPYNQNIDKDELIVHCVSFKQKSLIKEIKDYVRSYVPEHVTI